MLIIFFLLLWLIVICHVIFINPLVPRAGAHNSEWQNLQFPLQIKQLLLLLINAGNSQSVSFGLFAGFFLQPMH